MATFKKIPTGDETLDRVQQNIEEFASSIPDPTTPNVVTVTGNYTVTGNEDVLHVNAQGGPIKVTLQKPSTTNRPLQIKQVNLQNSKSKVNQVTIASPDGSKTIAGQSTYQLDTSGTGSVSITADNSQHYPVAGAGGNPAVSPTTSTRTTIINNVPASGLVNLSAIPPIFSSGGTSPTISLLTDATLTVDSLGELGFRQSAPVSLVGNPTGSTAIIEDITLGTGLGFVGTTLVNTSPLSSLTATLPLQITGTDIEIRGAVTTGGTTTSPTNLGALASGVLENVVSGGVSTPTVFASTGGRVPFGSGTNGGLTDSSNLTFASSTSALTVTGGAGGATVAISNSTASSGATVSLSTDVGNVGSLIMFGSTATGGNAHNLRIANTDPSGAIVFNTASAALLSLSGLTASFRDIGFFSVTSTATTPVQTVPTAVRWNVSPPVFASTATMTPVYQFDGPALSLTGTTNYISNSFAAFSFGAPSFTGASAVNLDRAATMIIKGAPTVTSPVTQTNPYALWVQSGNVRFDSLNAGGLVKSDTTGTLRLGVPGTDYAPAGNYITALTGDVTATGPGSVAATIATHAVTYAKMQQASTVTLLGNPTGSTANVSEITLGSGLAFSGTTLVATGSGGTVTTVTGTAPIFITSTPTTTPNVTIQGSITSGSTSTAAQNLGSLTSGLLKQSVAAGVATLAIAVSGTDYQPAGNYITALTGDVTATGPGSVAATLHNIPNDTTMAGDLLATAITAPSTPATGKARIYVDSTSKNLAVKNDAGTVNHGIQSNAGTAHQWVSAIADNGTVTLSQPSYADISGTLMSAGPGINLTVSSTQINLGSVASPTAPTIAEFANVPPSAASAATMQAVYLWDLVNITLTGTTHVTGNGLALASFAGPSITDSSAVTVDTASTLLVTGPPTAGGSVTLTKPYSLWVAGGATQLDGAVAVNGVTVPNNVSLIVGHTTESDRDRIQFFVGAGTLGATGTGDNTFVDIIPANSNIRSGVTAGIYATQRIRNLTYTGVSSPTITEAASLYIDGAPTVSSATISGTGTWAIHVKSGGTLLEGNFLVLSSGTPQFNVSTIGPVWLFDGGAGAGLSALSQTTGFTYIPTTGGGAPTGTPANIGSRAGATAVVYDQTGDHLYIWNPLSSTWRAH